MTAHIQAPPAKYIKRTRPFQDANEHLIKPVAHESCHEYVKIDFNRSGYNREIGRIVDQERLCQCQDLPSLELLGYSADSIQQIFGKRRMNE